MKFIVKIALTLALTAVALVPAGAEDLTLKTAEAPVPDGISDAIGALLQEEALQLTAGDEVAFSFWLRKEFPLSDAPEDPKSALEKIPPTALIGAVEVVADEHRDYRDDEIYPGVYTMRFGLQPEDGNHLGTSEYSFFAVLVPASMDEDPDGLSDHEEMVEASGEDTATAHPVILSLRPVNVPGGETPKLNEPVEEHKSLRVKVPAKAEGGDAIDLEFEIVYEGHGEL